MALIAKSDIRDLGYDSSLTRGESTFANTQQPPPALTNSIVAGINTQALEGGEFRLDNTLVSGFIESSNFIADQSGWQIHSDGSVEMETLALRSTSNTATLTIATETTTETALLVAGGSETTDRKSVV